MAKVSRDLEGCRQPAGEPAPVLPSCLGFLCWVPSCLFNLRRCSSLILVRSLRRGDTAPTVVLSPPAASQTQNHTGDYDMPSDVLDGEPLEGEPLEDPEEELPEHDEVLCVEAAEKGLASVQEEGVGVPAEPAKKKRKEMGREEILRDDRLRAKLRRLVRSQRLSKFPQIEKLWNGTDADQKSLMDQWLQTDGNEDKVEAHFKVALQVHRGVKELEEKLTIKQMKERGFSKWPGLHSLLLCFIFLNFGQ